jgi:hypothetical protein
MYMPRNYDASLNQAYKSPDESSLAALDHNPNGIQILQNSFETQAFLGGTLVWPTTWNTHADLLADDGRAGCPSNQLNQLDPQIGSIGNFYRKDWLDPTNQNPGLVGVG